MKLQFSALQIAAFFGCSENQVKAQKAKNAAQLSGMAKTAKQSGKKVNGFTHSQLEAMAAKLKTSL